MERPRLTRKSEEDLMSSGGLVAKRTEPLFDYLMVNNQYWKEAIAAKN